MNDLFSLPLELRCAILEKISYHDHLQIALVSKILANTLKSEYLWKQIYYNKHINKYEIDYLNSCKRYLTTRWKWNCKKAWRSLKIDDRKE